MPNKIIVEGKRASRADVIFERVIMLDNRIVQRVRVILRVNGASVRMPSRYRGAKTGIQAAAQPGRGVISRVELEIIFPQLPAEPGFQAPDAQVIAEDAIVTLALAGSACLVPDLVANLVVLAIALDRNGIGLAVPAGKLRNAHETM